ncbi:choice-of-anchor D domain-containing protein [Wenzhouxiangella sediminis]|uniref:Choice-of-anchor D domain-containing protein n=1 Tax=Wenzhouxiangella sediminis TaxID=1792836 RepID=A0A3E1K592_9GAMM|nr:choice-of-anchor D domain-containing protein [Wenzhouxiangella sediminis]RFF29203.1 choice-of-anchor D domain-containing protein [Wenzhouxiangella sediminis]
MPPAKRPLPRQFPALSALVLVTFALTVGPALAQQGGGSVSLGTASGAPGTTVSVAFEFDNTEDADVLEARARIQGIDAFSAVDVGNLCDSSAALIVSCVLNDTNRLVVSAANLSGTPIASFTGTLELSIAPDAPGGTDVLLEWNAPQDQDLLFTPSASVDGLVSIISDGPQVDLSPSSLDFGDIEAGQSSPARTVHVSNSGNADGLQISTVSTASADFAISQDDCASTSLAQGEFCSVQVVFAPTTDGALNDSLSVATNVGTIAASLTGTGTAAGLAPTPAPGTIDFGVVGVGDSATVDGQFTNDGSAPLDIDCSLAPADENFQTVPVPLSFSDVAPSDSVDFTLTFTPTSGEEQTATITCQSNALDLPEFEYQLSAPGLFIFSDRFEP